jgi:hypothetical protein
MPQRETGGDERNIQSEKVTGYFYVPHCRNGEADKGTSNAVDKRTSLGLSLATGIIFMILSLNPNINIMNPFNIPNSPMQNVDGQVVFLFDTTFSLNKGTQMRKKVQHLR